MRMHCPETTMRRLLVVAALALASCATPPSTLTSARPFQWSTHPGIWLSSGYGYAVDARGDAPRLFHVAADICVEDPLGGEDLSAFSDLYRSTDAQTLLVSSRLDPYEVRFRKADALPAACASPTPDTPIANFEAFVGFYSAHYAFFDLYDVDWAARTAAARPRVRADTSESALYELIVELLLPLKDSHIKVEAEIGGETRVHDGNPGKTELAVAAWGERNGIAPREAVGRFRRAYWFNDIRDGLLGGTGIITGNGRIQ
jgi:carboxyl-terminal processing protease